MCISAWPIEEKTKTRRAKAAAASMASVSVLADWRASRLAASPPFALKPPCCGVPRHPVGA